MYVHAAAAAGWRENVQLWDATEDGSAQRQAVQDLAMVRASLWNGVCTWCAPPARNEGAGGMLLAFSLVVGRRGGRGSTRRQICSSCFLIPAFLSCRSFFISPPCLEPVESENYRNIAFPEPLPPPNAFRCCPGYFPLTSLTAPLFIWGALALFHACSRSFLFSSWVIQEETNEETERCFLSRNTDHIWHDDKNSHRLLLSFGQK